MNMFLYWKLQSKKNYKAVQIKKLAESLSKKRSAEKSLFKKNL